MAQELRIPLEEAENCINDLLEMEREELDPFREAKVTAAYQEMVGQWDKDMKPMQPVIEVEPETDDQSLSDEGYETPPDEPFVEVETPEQEQRGGEPVELIQEQKVCPVWADRGAQHGEGLLVRKKREENASLEIGSKLQRKMPRLWKSSFGGSRAGSVWSLWLMTRVVCCRNVWMIRCTAQRVRGASYAEERQT